MRLMKLHFYYFWSKRHLLIMGLFLIIGWIVCFSNVYLQTGSDYVNHAIWHLEYQSSFATVQKLLLTVIAIFLLGGIFLPENDSYYLIYLSARPRIFYYVTTKLFVAVFCYFIMSILAYMIYIINGLLGTTWYYWTPNEGIFLLTISINALVYGLSAVILALVFKNFLAFILALAFFALLEMLESSNTTLPMFLYALLPLSNQATSTTFLINRFCLIIVNVFMINLLYYLRNYR